MAGYPVGASYLSSAAASDGLAPFTTLTDQNGKTPAHTFTKGPARFFPWDSFYQKSVIQTEIGLSFFLPEIHRTAKYNVKFRMDYDPARAEDGQPVSGQNLPQTIKPAQYDARKTNTIGRSHGALYSASTGAYLATSIAANGRDRRAVPLVSLSSHSKPDPWSPMIEVVADSALLEGERGYALYIILIIPDPSTTGQKTAERLIQRALAQGLRRLQAKPAGHRARAARNQSS